MEATLVLARATRGAGAAALVRQATAQPGLFAFAELLAVRGVAELEGTEHQAALNLLRLFSYGTYAEWRANPASYPELTPAHVTKLRQLTLVTLAEQQKHLAYDVLLRELDVANVRALEDLVIDAIYQGIVRAKLDQRTRAVEVEHTIGRDLRPGELDELAGTLDAWAQRANHAVALIDENVHKITTRAQQAERERDAFEADLERMKSRSAKRPDTSGDDAAAIGSDFSSPEYHDEDSRTRSGPRAGSAKVAKSAGATTAASAVAAAASASRRPSQRS